MNEEPRPEPEEFVTFELDDPEAEPLLLLAAQKCRMDPSDYLAILVDCERRGIKPLWRAPSTPASSA
jgi:hypothetical protein